MNKDKKMNIFHTWILLLTGLILLCAKLPVNASTQRYSVDAGKTLLFGSSPGDSLFSISEAPYTGLAHHGYVQGVYPGFTTVTCRTGTSSGKKAVEVRGILPSNPYLYVGQKQALHLFGVGASSVTGWGSSDPSVAFVSKDGILHARREGTTRIVCRLRNGKIYDTVADVTVRFHQTEEKSDIKSENEQKENKDSGSFLLSCEQTTYLMQPGHHYKAQVRIRKGIGRTTTPSLQWSSSNPKVAKVGPRGTITAIKEGTATITCQAEDRSIQLSVNVIAGTKSGGSCELTLLTGNPSKERTYTLYKQNAHNYDSYDTYLAWHGCAHCSLATVLGAYNEKYKGIKPNEIISGIEKQYADPKAWSREHEEHSLRYQMPLSLNGISTLLTKGNVSNEYVPFFSYKKARADIIQHLKTGNPVILEVRQKSSVTKKSSRRWTNSYHTMIFLGIFTSGKVLLCDSVDRSWYEGGQRYKIVSIDDVMEYMFTSTKRTSSMYYNGAASDGGYIKIYDENSETRE